MHIGLNYNIKVWIKVQMWYMRKKCVICFKMKVYNDDGFLLHGLCHKKEAIVAFLQDNLR